MKISEHRKTPFFLRKQKENFDKIKITKCALIYYCWLEVGIRKVLRPATSTQVFLGFPVSISKY